MTGSGKMKYKNGTMYNGKQFMNLNTCNIYIFEKLNVIIIIKSKRIYATNSVFYMKEIHLLSDLEYLEVYGFVWLKRESIN